MQIYEYKCPECGSRILTGVRGDRHDAWCRYCNMHVEHRRVFSLSVHRPMQEHWNDTVGEPVSTMAGFKEALKRKGDEYSARTGIDCNYQPVDFADVKPAGVDEMREQKQAAGAA